MVDKAQGKKLLSGIEPSPSFPRSFGGNPGCTKLLDSRQEHAGMTDGGIGRTISSCHAPKCAAFMAAHEVMPADEARALMTKIIPQLKRCLST